MRTLTRPGTYRPPRGGEPSRLREDGHWSTQGLVGYWPMNEGRGSVVHDVSPFGNHGTMTNMDPATDWVAGQDGAALDFDGADDYVAVSQTTGILATLTNATLIVRVRHSMIASANSPAIYAERSVKPTPVWKLAVCQPAYAPLGWVFAHRDNANPITYVSAPARTNDGYWHQFVVAKSAKSVSLYTDGILVTGPQALNGSDTLSVTMTRIAMDPNTGHAFAGNVSDVCIYSRALSADEIAALYRDPYLPLWRPRMGISLAMLTPAAGLPLITSRTLGRIGPSLRGLR